jgi:hypothetical protein
MENGLSLELLQNMNETIEGVALVGFWGVSFEFVTNVLLT